MGTKDSHGTDPEPDDIATLRAAGDKLGWAAPRARYHLVRLGKWRRDRGDPTADQLSGAGTLVKVGHRKGILTAAHCITAKFPRGAYKGQTMEAIVGKRGRPTAWTDIDLSHAAVEGGIYAKGEPQDMGPDIAWIPLHPEKAGFFERHGKVFFGWREGRFPATADGDSPKGGSSPHFSPVALVVDGTHWNNTGFRVLDGHDVRADCAGRALGGLLALCARMLPQP